MEDSLLQGGWGTRPSLACCMPRSVCRLVAPGLCGPSFKLKGGVFLRPPASAAQEGQFNPRAAKAERKRRKKEAAAGLGDMDAEGGRAGGPAGGRRAASVCATHRLGARFATCLSAPPILGGFGLLCQKHYPIPPLLGALAVQSMLRCI